MNIIHYFCWLRIQILILFIRNIYEYIRIFEYSLHSVTHTSHFTLAPYSLLSLSQNSRFWPHLVKLMVNSNRKARNLKKKNSIWFRNLWPIFFVWYQGTLGLLFMSKKWHQSRRHQINQAISMNGPAL